MHRCWTQKMIFLLCYCIDLILIKWNSRITKLTKNQWYFVTVHGATAIFLFRDYAPIKKCFWHNHVFVLAVFLTGISLSAVFFFPSGIKEQVNWLQRVTKQNLPAWICRLLTQAKRRTKSRDALIHIHVCIPANCTTRWLHFFLSLSPSQTHQHTDAPHTYSVPPNPAARTQKDH